MVAYTKTFGTAGSDTLKAGVRPEMLFGGPGDDTLTTGRTYDSLLLGGTGNDTYTAGSSGQSAFVIETGGDPNDSWVDNYTSWPWTVMATLDDRHLVLTTYSGSNTVIFYDWQRPGNIIETWTFKNTTMSHAEFASALTSSPNFYGNMLSSRLPVAIQNVFSDLIDESMTRAAAFEREAKTTTSPGTGSPFGGDDSLQGTTGADTISGYGGNDTISGGAGQDVLYGNLGRDSLVGGDADDTLYGGQDADTLWGGQDSDVLYGQLGNDLLWGDSGNDTLYGGQGDDSLYSWSGADVLYGNLGDDSLMAGEGDTLYGGAGADRFTLFWDRGNAVVADFNVAEGDRLRMFSTAAPESVTADAAGNTVLTFTSLGTITLRGIAPTSYSSAWFTD